MHFFFLNPSSIVSTFNFCQSLVYMLFYLSGRIFSYQSPSLDLTLHFCLSKAICKYGLSGPVFRKHLFYLRGWELFLLRRASKTEHTLA